MVCITELRQKLGLSVTELAEKLNVAESTVYRWESGDTSPRLDQFFKLQEIFGADIEALKRPTNERKVV
jgi:transcriptional regulator with XRE-family HTH domain